MTTKLRLTSLQAQIGYYSTQARTKLLASKTPSPQASTRWWLSMLFPSSFLPCDGNAGPPTSGSLRCAPPWKRPHTSGVLPNMLTRSKLNIWSLWGILLSFYQNRSSSLSFIWPNKMQPNQHHTHVCHLVGTTWSTAKIVWKKRVWQPLQKRKHECSTHIFTYRAF